MTTIRLLRLTLEHFKGIGHMVLSLEGRSARISGDNGTGKTTLFDAYTWLLTGKDSQGRVPADSGGFDLKPLDPSGAVADRSNRSVVEGVLWVDGREVVLRREYYELWTEKRGSPVASYDGNSTDLFVDGVPKTLRQYREAVEELVPAELLRLLSNPAAFPALRWQERREILFDLTRLESDRELMAADPAFALLLDALGDLSLDDLRKKLLTQRKELNKTRDAIPARLDELKRAEEELSGLPFDELRQEAARLEEEERRLSVTQAAGQSEQIAALENKVGALRNELDRLELENRQHRASQVPRGPSRRELESALTQARLSYRYESERYHSARRDGERAERSLSDCRSRWGQERGRRYPGNAVCPTCGQSLPRERQREARETWEEHQRQNLERIEEEGERYSKLLAHAREAEERQKAAMIRWEGEIARAQEALDALKPAPEICDLDHYRPRKAELEEALSSARSALDQARRATDAAGRQLRREREEVSDRLRAIREGLAQEGTLLYARERQEDLREEAKELSRRLSDCDRLLSLADQFTRYKADHVTREVNGRFSLAQFRLFVSQVNGGLNPCCDILCGGVPYESGLNTGARMAVGLDILDTLSRHYGYRLPVWVDNAESVTRMPRPENQVIALTVDESRPELAVKLEV